MSIKFATRQIIESIRSDVIKICTDRLFYIEPIYEKFGNYRFHVYNHSSIIGSVEISELKNANIRVEFSIGSGSFSGFYNRTNVDLTDPNSLDILLKKTQKFCKTLISERNSNGSDHRVHPEVQIFNPQANRNSLGRSKAPPFKIKI